MKHRFALPIVSVAVVGLMAVFATTTMASPTKTAACTGCHSGANVAVAATLASPAGATATYNFSAPGANAVVVFDGPTKLFTFTAVSGQFTVASGKTYTLYAVTGPDTGNGVGSTTVSPVVAPPVVVADTTAPITTSDVKSSYVANAVIRLTASDAGSGVANTYYLLDSGVQTAGTTINVSSLGAHTLEFWSVDASGNIEAHKTAGFSVTAPVVVQVPTVRTVKVNVKVAKGHAKGLTAVLTNTATGETFKAKITKRGNATFNNVPSGSYTLTVKGKKVKFKARTVVVGDFDVSVSGMRVTFRR